MGETPLNAVLERIPELFVPGAGPRKVVLLSDGGNSCAPQRNTCDLARELYIKHRITIEIVGFVVDPALASEFECIAQVTGGHFVAPSDIKSWLSFRVPAIDPWPMIVFALGYIGGCSGSHGRLSPPSSRARSLASPIGPGRRHVPGNGGGRPGGTPAAQSRHDGGPRRQRAGAGSGGDLPSASGSDQDARTVLMALPLALTLLNPSASGGQLSQSARLRRRSA